MRIKIKGTKPTKKHLKENEELNYSIKKFREQVGGDKPNFYVLRSLIVNNKEPIFNSYVNKHMLNGGLSHVLKNSKNLYYPELTFLISLYLIAESYELKKKILDIFKNRDFNVFNAGLPSHDSIWPEELFNAIFLSSGDIGDMSSEIQYLKNPTPQLIDKLKNLKNERVNYALLKHPDISNEAKDSIPIPVRLVQSQFGYDEFYEDESTVDLRHFDDSLLTKLMMIGRNTEVLSDVRLATANNKTASAYLLNKLSKDPFDEIRLAVTQNPNTAIRTLEILTKDKNDFVSWKARERLEQGFEEY